MIADPHPIRLHLIGKLVEQLGLRQPILLCSRGHRRHNEEFVANDLVELDGFLEFIFQYRLIWSVRATRDDAIVIQHLSQLLRRAPVIPCKLDALVTDF